MTNKITRRDWLIGGTALAGGLVLAANGHAQSVTIEGYVPTPENPIRMSSNENPYGVSKAASIAMCKAHKYGHLYGGGGAQKPLTELIAGIENVPVENVMVAGGSGEILKTIALIVAMEGGKILAPQPTYDDTFMDYSDRRGIEKIWVPVADDLSIDLDAMKAAYTDDVKIIYLCNPNNPIPTVMHGEKLKAFVKEFAPKCYVFVDEAYYEYVNDPNYQTMIPLVTEYPNLVVTRTASKIHGFAGIRIGFGFGSPEFLGKIKSLMTGSINGPAMWGAIESYKDKEYQQFVLRKNAEALQILYDFFEKHNMRYIKSNANFTFFETGIDSKEVYDRVRKHGIAIGRPFPPLLKWMRISTARPEDMVFFTEVYEKEFFS
ncbi:MAG: aminotransferase class I/II-fold pyridoxal phosphate-dependent enzyme [Alphaproteobacteria bacterium]|nr:aminotransferase class I/II-fold pyridoxal phosphate-dependent enzyme [Alphaproteobacteria bacterium]HPF45942.1 histidinol-phosphate transaminase [Emcibacteraceae bacterium]HRW28393.1 histidinol-phosphate transaminase [Emcibacteraceae bacterium]